MKQALISIRKAARRAGRVSVVLVTLFSMLAPLFTYAAVPTYVVEFELNTKFERSLERFLFDLFNTLQRRDEDFTAAFELQKIEKAREDTAKLFQETQQELQGFGYALSTQTTTDYVRDPRLTGQPGDCEGGTSDEGCPPTISPLKDSRIVHDPYQYLFGDARTKAQLYAYCFFNYLAWDQQGLLDDRYPWLTDPVWNLTKSTYNADGDLPPGEAEEASVNTLLERRNRLVVQVARGNYYQLNNPLHFIYGDTSEAQISVVEPRCRQVMYIVGAESPVTAEQKVNVWIALQTQSGLPPTPNQINDFRRTILDLPSLNRGLINLPVATGANWVERSIAWDEVNRIDGVTQIAMSQMAKIVDETEREREATYIAGQGIRPEQLYETHVDQSGSSTPPAQFDVNTEYIISPAVMLLQKMQAATQAQFDLAGQGFLYLDAESTPEEVLGAYNLATTAGNEEERRICNNAGACQLLDAWLKPVASFRSTTTIGLGETAAGITSVPLRIGPSEPGLNDVVISGTVRSPLLGSGLPAPWEDEGSYVNIASEKTVASGSIVDRRYTVARYLVEKLNVFLNPGANLAQDEFDVPTPNGQDQIGSRLLGLDYPLNDWYDRVTEMYEAGIGQNSAGESLRPDRSRQFTVRDWQCYVGSWFSRQVTGSVAGSGIAAYFYGTNTVDSYTVWAQFCP